MNQKCQALLVHRQSVREQTYGVSMDTIVCVVCAARDPEGFPDPDALLCAECEARWAVCLDCDEAFVIAEASTSLRCEPCLVVHRRPARLAA